MTGKQINLLNQSKNHNKYVIYIVFILNTVQSFPYIIHLILQQWCAGTIVGIFVPGGESEVLKYDAMFPGPQSQQGAELGIQPQVLTSESVNSSASVLLYGTALLLVNKFDFRALGIVIKSNISKIPRTERCLPESRSPWVTTTDSKHLIAIKTKPPVSCVIDGWEFQPVYHHQ